MRLSIRLALRNLLRNRRRSLLTLVAVIVPVVLLDISWGFTGGFEQSLFEDTVRLQTGHLQIHKSGYEEIGQTITLLRDVRPVIDALESSPDIEWHTSRLELPALLATGSRSKGVLVQGVEPEKAKEISLFHNWIVDGVYLTEAADNINVPAVIGSSLVEELAIGESDRLVILSSHPESGTGVLSPAHIGTINAPMRELNRGFVQLKIEDARKLIKLDNAATSVIAMVSNISGIEDADRISRVATELQSALGDEYVVETWEELAPEIWGYLRIARPMMLAFMLVFFLLAGLVVLNTIYLSLLERSKEMGVILALGAGRLRVLRMIAVEALVLSSVGAFVGSVIGVLLVLWGRDGIALPESYTDIYTQLGVNPEIAMSMSMGEAVLSAAIMVVIAFLAGILPAIRTSNLEPVNIIRGIHQ